MRKIFTLLILILLLPVTALAATVENITYLDENGTQQTAASATQVTNSDTQWTDGWYVAQSNITIDGTVTISGNVHLILEDGCNLTVNGGILLQSDSQSDSNMYIYAQSTEKERMGSLTATGTDAGFKEAGYGTQTLTIAGGKISASGSDEGISAVNLTITDGYVSASGTDPYGDSIAVYNATISGGFVDLYGDFTGTLSTGIDGHAVISSTGEIKNIAADCKGFFLIQKTGKIYGDTFTLTQDLNIANSNIVVTVEEGQTLTLDDGVTLTIPVIATLTNNGIVNNNGTIINTGTLNNSGTLNNNGNLNNTSVLNNAGSIVNNGTLTGEVGGNGTVTPKITTDSLSDGTVGEPYSAKLQATGNNITWSVASGNLPTGLTLESNTGTISGTPTAAGTSTFTVTAENSAGSASKKFTIQIAHQPIAITTQPADVSVQEGQTATFTVGATGESLSYQWQQSTDRGSSWTDIDDATSVSYTTAATTMNMNGYQYCCKVTGADNQTVTSNAATLTVTPVPVTGVSLDKITLELFTGNTATLTATVHPDNATNQNVTWSSDKPEVATVDNGTVTAVGAGEATITVTTEDGCKTATCIVTVTVPVTGVKLNKETLELFTDGSETLTATVEPGNATNKNVTWSSSDETIATVDNNGTVTAVGAGEATITATAGGITATCVVHVRKPATVEASGSTNLSFTTDRNEFTLTAFVYGENLSQEPNCWEWTVANTDVVSLSDTPNLRSGSVASSRKAFTIKGTGTTTITATYDDGTYRGSVDFKVRISKPTPPDPISYYNIYVEDVCDGVEVSTSKQVVREGGSINVYVEKDTARYTFDNFKVYYKRSYYGTWDELKEGTQPGEYPIKNIWTHIYIKAEGAEEKEDPTGIESIEGVKVYTKDGSLYVQTPQREQVIIVSMSGAVVKNEEQIGLKQYHGLQPGIYIVRVGDRAYKVRLN